MNRSANVIPDLKLIKPRVFKDARGFFFESFNQQQFEHEVGSHYDFVQDNHSQSTKNILRGLHYQIEHPQGKLVRVVSGKVFDVAVDLRKSSETYGRWMGFILDASDPVSLWIPPGFAHGFVVLSDTADFLYKTTDYYYPAGERCLRWNDPDVGIEWPAGVDPILSDKDAQGKSLHELEVFG